jgi:uncharacterized protein (UPF0332 family)
VSVTPSDWLNEARRYAESAEEISLRTAVSRGYYAGYHRALEVSCLCPNPPPFPDKTQGVHASLIRRFDSAPKSLLGSALAREIGVYLTRGRALRVIADYKLGKTIRINDARRSIYCAEQIDKLATALVEKHTQ